MLNRALAIAVTLLCAACSESTPNAVCTHNGKTYVGGESFPKGDGCNTCTCDSKSQSAHCTEQPCVPHPDGGLRDRSASDKAVPDAAASGIAFSTVGMGTGSAGSLASQFNLTIQDDTAWKDLLAKLAGTASASVDFGSETVLAVGLGLRPSGGYSVEVKAVGMVAGLVQVTYLEATPGEGCAVPTVVTRPWHAVKITQQTSPIRFLIKRAQAPACQTPPPVLCAAEKAAVSAELDRINHCVVDGDCVVVGGSCPFGCYFFREKSETTTELQKLIQAHDAKCTACAYKCAAPPTASEIVCVGSICQKLLI